MDNEDFERFGKLVLDEFKRLHTRLENFEERFDRIDDQFLGARSELADIRERAERLEEASSNYSGFPKEIDHLLSRVTHIEKHLNLRASVE